MNDPDELIDLLEKILSGETLADLTEEDKKNPFREYQELWNIIHESLREIQFYKKYKKYKK